MIGQQKQDLILILKTLHISLLKEDRIQHPIHLPPLLLLTILRKTVGCVSTVKQQFESCSQEVLHIIINGTAGAGKSYLINCLRLLLFGGCSVILFGDFGQLPSVMDLPLYTSVTCSDLSDQGYRAYSQFEKAFTLTQVMRQCGQDTDQIRFRDILLRLRNAETTKEDWNNLMEQTPTKVQDQSSFVDAL